MPTRPQPYCRGRNRRCPNKAVIHGLCKDCHDEREREYDAQRPNATARGYDARWRETRRAYLNGHPYCESDACKALPAWKRPAAREVDHIDGLGPLGPRGHDPDNLRALCKPCHSKRTARDQPGGWHRAGGVAKDDEFYT
ncbi:MAG: HNH endonuclease signature motif containing protein [Actinocrinis sp.]